MNQTIQNDMQAVALDRFGGPETMQLKKLPVPEVAPDELLIRVEASDVGVWDPFEREGGFAREFGLKASFPYVMGSGGAGTVAAVGGQVKNFKEGDRVYALSLMNPKGGFYAQYAAVKAAHAAPIPGNLSMEQAAAMAVDAVTALRGLDVLNVTGGESLLIFGASGGIGHLAVQFAKRMDARVFAVASGADGVDLVRKLGADAVVDGRKDDVAEAARRFSPHGIDAALLTAGGDAAVKALAALKEGGRVAHPNGIEPELPKVREGIAVKAYDGEVDAEIIAKVNDLINAGPFQVNVARTFPLAQAAEAHRALGSHYLGKLALRPGA